jgi:hypothetical protein
MRDPRVRLKNPWVAGVLGFLIPGAGHLYQGRLFKAVVYFFCILGLYFTGMQMADWKAVYVHRPGNAIPRGKSHMLQFLAQAGVGLPAVCALIQNKRYYSPENVESHSLSGPLNSPFRGEWQPATSGDEVDVEGFIELEPAEGRFGNSVSGKFFGTDEEGNNIELELGERITLEEPVNASRSRDLDVGVVETKGDSTRVIGALNGEIPRPFQDWFVVPVTTAQERKLHGNLGKFHELAMVFTWVAGLLNILAVWDALEGPAYGYGDDETSEVPPEDKHRDRSDVAEAKPARAAARVGA